MKTKLQKKDDLKKLKEKMPKSGITIFTTFARAGEKGLSVQQIQELKKALRAANSQFTTAKKTLLEIALRDLKYDGVDVYGMAGSMGLVIGAEDPYAIAKKVYDFAKKNQALQLFGALLDGKFVTKADVLAMATMPSRDVLLSRLLGMMMYPISSLAMVLKQIADKSGEGASAPTEQAEVPAEVPSEKPAPASDGAPLPAGADAVADAVV